ncbi:MAG: tetratricopeptide repeat protein [Myxococcota bacterium]
MKAYDAWGVPHHASIDDVAAWNAVVEAVASHHATTATQLDALLEESPDFAAAVALRGLALMFKGRRDLHSTIDTQLSKGERLERDGGLSSFDGALFRVLRAWRNDDYPTTALALEALVELTPTHLLAVKLQHGFLFLAGDREGMVRAIDRVLPQWDKESRGYGFVLGCASFAQGEVENYERADRLGRTAVEHQPDDAWGIHAVSHVYEMRDDNFGGAEWLEWHRSGFESCNNFRGHVFWHLALFELAQNHLDRVFELCDGEVRRAWCGDYRDMSNVASLLWRLEVDGIDVGDRWEELGEIAAGHHTDHGSAFADAHYVLALARCGRKRELEEFFASMDALAPSGCGQSAVVRGIGNDLCSAVAALGSGQYREAIACFERAAPNLTAVGGSNAQRDLFEQLHIHACLSAGDQDRSHRLLQRRLSQRPNNPWATQRRAAWL